MEEHTSERGKLIHLFVAAFIAILISSIFYFYYIGSFSGFDQTSNRFIETLNSFNELPMNSNIFIGDSQTREDINCIIIEDGNTSCYNFAIEGILPIQLALINKEIINAHPKNVIIGVSPLFFSEYINKNDDIFFFAADKKFDLDENVIKMLDNNEHKLVSMNWFKSELHKRKFILPFYLNLLKGIFSDNNISSKLNNFKDPYIFNVNEADSELQKKLNNSGIIELFKFNNSKMREIDAFSYLVKQLSMNNIKVTIVEMPLNPLLKEKINNESKKSFSLVISKIAKENNAKYFDISYNFKKEEFTDLSHLNEIGRNRLSKMIKEGELNVI